MLDKERFTGRLLFAQYNFLSRKKKKRKKTETNPKANLKGDKQRINQEEPRLWGGQTEVGNEGKVKVSTEMENFLLRDVVPATIL